MNEIILMLEDVDDQVCFTQQFRTLRIPSINRDYEEIIQICYTKMENQVYSYAEYEMKNWSLLFPIQYIFEGFIAEYIRKHFDDILKVKPHKSGLYLHTNLNTFNLQQDILLINKKTGEQIIVDTKYKSRWNLEKAIQRKG